MKNEKLIVNNEEYNVVGGDALIDPKKNNHAITLIALIITIIILLILAAVTINVLIGDNGLFNITKESGEDYKQARSKRKIRGSTCRITRR